MIKNICLVLISVCALSKSFAQDKKFTVSGDIKGLDTKAMRIFIDDKKEKQGWRMDSILVTDGKFSYTGEIDGLGLIDISHGIARASKKTRSGFVPSASSRLSFFAQPGSKVKFSGSITDFADAYPSGDETNNELASLNKIIYPMMSEAAFTYVKINNKQITDPDSVKALEENSMKLGNQVFALKKKFIAEHLSSTVSAWLLEDMMLRSQISNEEAITLFKKMDGKKLGSLSYYLKVSKRIDGIYATRLGSQVPDISTSRTPDGHKFELSALRGKYVIIDFWGTWCMPCIAGMPKMKEYLNKYKGRLDIVGIAQEGDDGTKWREMIKSRELTWHHVLDSKDKKYVGGFNVAGFPTKIIVDPQGKILGRYTGEVDELYTKIDELMK